MPANNADSADPGAAPKGVTVEQISEESREAIAKARRLAARIHELRVREEDILAGVRAARERRIASKLGSGTPQR
jgi:hypothetical protein